MHTVNTSSPKLKKPNQVTLNSALSIAKKKSNNFSVAACNDFLLYYTFDTTYTSAIYAYMLTALCRLSLCMCMCGS